MIPAVLTFVLCIIIILGAYWGFVVGPEDRAARDLRRRLHKDRSERPLTAQLIKKAQPLSALKALDALLLRSGYLTQPIQRLIAIAGLPLTVGMVLLACALSGMLTFLLLGLSISYSWFTVIPALLMAPVPYMLLGVAAKRRTRRLEEQFPQAVDLIAVSLRAGHAFPTSLLMVAEEVADPLGGEFRLLYDQQNYGKPLPDVLKEFTERIPLLDARIFATAVLTQREAGGNLAEVLDKLSALIRERFKINRQVRVVSAHGRITGWVLAALPPVVAGSLFFLAPDHIKTLVTDPFGVQLTVAAIVLQIVGTVAIRRIVNIEL
jgi:tight adherence protein B